MLSLTLPRHTPTLPIPVFARIAQRTAATQGREECVKWTLLLPFPADPGSEAMRQRTKSLRSSPLRGGGSREAGSKPIG